MCYDDKINIVRERVRKIPQKVYTNFKRGIFLEVEKNTCIFYHRSNRKFNLSLTVCHTYLLNLVSLFQRPHRFLHQNRMGHICLKRSRSPIGCGDYGAFWICLAVSSFVWIMTFALPCSAIGTLRNGTKRNGTGKEVHHRELKFYQLNSQLFW